MSVAAMKESLFKQLEATMALSGDTRFMANFALEVIGMIPSECEAEFLPMLESWVGTLSRRAAKREMVSMADAVKEVSRRAAKREMATIADAVKEDSK